MCPSSPHMPHLRLAGAAVAGRLAAAAGCLAAAAAARFLAASSFLAASRFGPPLCPPPHRRARHPPRHRRPMQSTARSQSPTPPSRARLFDEHGAAVCGHAAPCACQKAAKRGAVAAERRCRGGAALSRRRCASFSGGITLSADGPCSQRPRRWAGLRNAKANSFQSTGAVFREKLSPSRFSVVKGLESLPTKNVVSCASHIWGRPPEYLYCPYTFLYFSLLNRHQQRGCCGRPSSSSRSAGPRGSHQSRARRGQPWRAANTLAFNALRP